MSIPSYRSGILFTKAHGLVRQRVYTILEGHGLTPTSWSVLGMTAARPDGIRLSAVAEAIDMTPSMITMMADDLVSNGLIRRVPHHSDGRVKLLVITPTGKKQAATIEKQLDSEIRTLMKGVSDRDIQLFQKTLETIIRNASS